MAARAGGHEAQADADAIKKDRVGENGHAANADQDAGVTEPGGGKGGMVPAGKIRRARGSGRGIELIEPAKAASASAQKIGDAQERGIATEAIREGFPGGGGQGKE